MSAQPGVATAPTERVWPIAGRTEEPALVRSALRRHGVALAAAGRSNQDIAARLVVSVRTVEGHLYRAFAKLGVADRGELAHCTGRSPR